MYQQCNLESHINLIQAVRKTLGSITTGFVRVLENPESPGILLWHFPGLESPGKGLLVLESFGNLLI